MSNIKLLPVTESNQEALSCQLMDELRDTCFNAKYSHMHVSTLLGVLEMLKLEMHERNK